MSTPELLASARPSGTAVPEPRRSVFYLVITSAMTGTMVVGFAGTYFRPMVEGSYPDVSPLVHVHGWSFFAWYALLPLQAWLIRSRNIALHRTLGLASTALGAIMIAIGFLVSTVQIDNSRGPDADPFWQLMGVPIFAVWLLFTVFYVEAMRRRRRTEEHKRLILLASAAALSAATFRIVVRFAGFGAWSAFLGTIAALVFPLIAMMHERRTRSSVHSIYTWGVLAALVLIAGVFLLGGTPAGDRTEQGLAWLGDWLRPLYMEP